MGETVFVDEYFGRDGIDVCSVRSFNNGCMERSGWDCWVRDMCVAPKPCLFEVARQRSPVVGLQNQCLPDHFLFIDFYRVMHMAGDQTAGQSSMSSDKLINIYFFK